MTTTTTKERPILFSGPMVRAIFADQKTQTRRVVKLRPENNTRIGPVAHQAHIESPEALAHCPYGSPGDRLWVREAYRFAQAPLIDMATGDEVEPNHWDDLREPDGVYYEADGDAASWRPVELNADEYEKYRRWSGKNKRAMRPGMFMFRSCSRLLLEITDVRVQRLQEISEEDARAEGLGPGFVPNSDGISTRCVGYAPLFFRIWNEINGSRPGCDASSNPWVWAITFKKAGGAA